MSLHAPTPPAVNSFTNHFEPVRTRDPITNTKPVAEQDKRPGILKPTKSRRDATGLQPGDRFDVVDDRQQLGSELATGPVKKGGIVLIIENNDFHVRF